MTAGLTPKTADEVNTFVGSHLRNLITLQETIRHDADSLAPLDLTAEPYLMTPADAANIQTAISGANTYLQAMDMTFINRLVGLF